ncbi:Hypothetical_protein [Hexamita inflata]|uniref:Hypothetical_protein n=1 Tax=Hexamita inflata TaxID=28002 RepID=A0AA86QXY8_9EUKA|nr:Hypothetical protein HINF_LOCUS49284 [Hexamita inflata]
MIKQTCIIFVMQFLDCAELALNNLIKYDKYDKVTSKISISLAVMQLTDRQYHTFLVEMSYYLNVTTKQVQAFFFKRVLSSLYKQPLNSSSASQYTVSLNEQAYYASSLNQWSFVSQSKTQQQMIYQMINKKK